VYEKVWLIKAECLIIELNKNFKRKKGFLKTEYLYINNYE